MKNVNKPPFRRPLSISVLSCVASVIGCSWFSNVLVQMQCPRQTTSSADAQVRGGSVIGASAGPASDDSSYFVLTRLVDDDDAEDTKSNEQQMSSVNEIATVNHATYFTAQCRLLVCLSILRSYFLADYRQTYDVIHKTGIHNISQRLQKMANAHAYHAWRPRSCNMYDNATVHCRLRVRHRLHDGLVLSRRQKLSKTRCNQYNAEGTLACARRRSDVARCDGIDMPSYGQIGANMTSFIKNWKYVTCRNAARGGPSHGHR